MLRAYTIEKWQGGGKMGCRLLPAHVQPVCFHSNPFERCQVLLKEEKESERKENKRWMKERLMRGNGLDPTE